MQTSLMKRSKQSTVPADIVDDKYRKDYSIHKIKRELQGRFINEGL